MKLPTLFLALALATGSAWVRADDGNEIFKKCAAAEKIASDDYSGNSIDIGYCLGFLHGIRVMAQAFVRTSICLPDKGITNGQTVMVLMKYLRAHPERLHEHDAVLVIESLKDAFPCR